MTSEMTRDPTYYKELAREDLGRYRQAKYNIDQMQELILRLRQKAETITQVLNADIVQTSKDKNGNESLLVKIADNSQMYRQKAIEAEELCLELETRISRVENELYQRILRYYWIYGLRLEEIAVREYHAYSTVKKYHWEALEAYGENIATNSP